MLILSTGDSTTKLEPNLTIPVRLDGKSPAILLYESSGNEFVTVTARAVDEVDTVIEVLNAEGVRLAYNDTHQSDFDGALSDTDAAIEHLHLSESGVYTVRVDTFSGASAGEVEVTLTVVESNPFEVEEISDSQTLIRVDLRKNGVFRYPLANGTSEAVYTISAKSVPGGRDAMLVLRSATGDVLAENDDHTNGNLTLDVFDAQISGFPVDDTETWLELREFLGRGGVFEILLETETIP